MKKVNLKSFIAGVLVTVFVISLTTTVFGAQLSKVVTTVYRDIKISIDGKEITPKDASGNTVEPFIIDGTTYLPVRAVAGAVGYDVGWDEKTSTVKLTKQQQGVIEDIQQVEKPQNVKYYKEYPTVPDFGAYLELELLLLNDINDSEKTVNYQYKGYKKDRSAQYASLLESLGFINAGNGGNYFYKASEVSIVILKNTTGDTEIICWKPNNTQKSSVKMYDDYPDVPDFGAFSGAKLKDVSVSFGSKTYLYEIVSIDVIAKYYELLVSNGFIYRLFEIVSGAVFYENENYTVAASVADYGTHVQIMPNY